MFCANICKIWPTEKRGFTESSPKAFHLCIDLQQRNRWSPSGFIAIRNKDLRYSKIIPNDKVKSTRQFMRLKLQIT